jgi:hypothetical protein
VSKEFFTGGSKPHTYIWASLLFNCFGLKMLIDVGNYNILSSLFFFHFIGSNLMALLLSAKRPGRSLFRTSCYHALTGLPSFGLILLHGNISFFHLTLYLMFVFSCMLTIQFLLLTYRRTLPLFYTLISLFFLWGTNVVIESIPMMYTLLAPLSISYHYSLVTQGIFHISTAIYMFILPLTFYGINYANNT